MITRRTLGAAGAMALFSALAAGEEAMAAAKPAKAAGRTGSPAAKTAAVKPPADLPFGQKELAAAQADLAAALVGRLGRAGPKGASAGNFAVSPMSLTGALSIIAMGCEESMQGVLRDTLQIKSHGADVFATLLKAFADVEHLKAVQPDFPLTVANRLVIDPGVRPVAAFLKGMGSYGVEVGEEDLAAPQTVEKINAWVKAQTKDLIPAILDRPLGHASLVALNALHFKDKWKAQFDPKDTKAEAFHSLDGKNDPVQTMHKSGHFAFRLSPTKDFVGVDLGFVNSRFSLVIVTSRKQPAKPDALVAAAKDWLAGGPGFVNGPGEIALPRLDIAGSMDLLQPLRDIGLKRAGPLPLFGARPPSISAITQRTVLKLDEQGAEAAAATAVKAMRAAESNYVKMTVDKPFLFALRDTASGFIILTGYVARPTTAAA